MSWRRILRALVAVAGLACAGAISFYYRRPRTPQAHVDVTRRDPDATLSSEHGTSLQYKGNDEQWQVEYQRMTGYADGRTRFDQPHYTDLLTHDDRQIQMWADVAESQGKGANGVGPGNVALSGHVRIETSDHWHIETEAATYDDATGRLVMPGLVRFTRDRLSGQGTGATYDKIHRVLDLAAQARIVMTPDATGAGGVDASAGHILVNRGQEFATLEGGAKLAREKEVIAADLQTLFFTADEKGLRQMSLRGHASVVPQTGAADAPPEMHADNADLAMQPDGHTLQHATLSGLGSSLVLASNTGAKTIRAPAIEVALAPDGQTVTNIGASGHVLCVLPPTADTPGRTISASTLTSAGDAKSGLKSAVFSGAVSFVEHVPADATHPAADRTGTSHVLALALNGDLGAIDSAEFREDVHFIDGDVDAVAPHAVYYETKGQLALDGVTAHTQPRVTNASVIVDANMATVATGTHDLEADGAVQTKTKPDPAKADQPSNGLFDESKPIFAAAAHLAYVDATQHATYTAPPGGLARLSQDDNEVRADVVVVDQTTNDLHATGHVASTFVTDDTSSSPTLTPAPSTKAPTRNHVTADEMVYTDASRVAHYIGRTAQARLESAQGVTTAATIDLTLAKETRTVDKMVADGAVYLMSPTREARGDHLDYTAATDLYVLRGVPAVAKLPDANSTPPKPQTCTLSTGSELTFTNGPGGGTGHAADGQTANWPCDKPLPPIKK